jgi:hypothetical protein
MPALPCAPTLEPDHVDLLRREMGANLCGPSLVCDMLRHPFDDSEESAVALELIVAAAEDLATDGDTFDPTSPWAAGLLAMPAGQYRRRGRLHGWLRPITAVVHHRLGDRPERWFTFGAEVESAHPDTPLSACVAAAMTLHP